MTRKKSYRLQDQATGSPDNGEPEFLAVGKLRRPHGVRGEIFLSVWTDFPERLKPGLQVFVGDDYHPLTIQSVRWHRDDLLIRFYEYTNREDVGILVNQILSVNADQLPELEEGEYYLHELLGLQVIKHDTGELLGQITEIIETGANDVYVVKPENGPELLLPAIDPVIREINFDQGEMRVHLLPGLLAGDE